MAHVTDREGIVTPVARVAGDVSFPLSEPVIALPAEVREMEPLASIPAPAICTRSLPSPDRLNVPSVAALPEKVALAEPGPVATASTLRLLCELEVPRTICVVPDHPLGSGRKIICDSVNVPTALTDEPSLPLHSRVAPELSSENAGTDHELGGVIEQAVIEMPPVLVVSEAPFTVAEPRSNLAFV